MTNRIFAAEFVFPGHPDKLSDAMRIALQSLLEGDSSCDFLEDFAQPDKTMPQQMLLPAGVSLQLGGQPVTSAAPRQVTIDSRGMATSSSSFKLTQGGQQNDEEGTLH